MFRNQYRALGLLVAALSLVAAAENAVNPFYGSFGTTVPIGVPSYHGLEPNLQLAYNSGSRNGTLGMGWSLGGFSRVDRVGPAHGAPTYTANDLYQLDGQDLVPCVGGSTSPSCLTGGTHSTRIENYTRIKFDGTNWYVWYKDGTVVTLTPLQNGLAQVCTGVTKVTNTSSDGCECPVGCDAGGVEAGCTCTKSGMMWKMKQTCVYTPTTCVGGTAGASMGVVSWGIKAAADTRGNAVNYSWACADPMPSQACYPMSASYNGTSINLIWEHRPDTMQVGNGTGFMAAYGGRLRAIDVRTNGSRVRAYNLTYSISPSGNSVLNQVQQFGTDASVNYGYNSWLSPSDVAVSGSALPPMIYGYAGTAPTFGNTISTGLLTDASGYADAQYYSTISYPDLNGDGRADLCSRGYNSLQCWLSTGTGYSTYVAGPAWATDPIFANPAYYSTINYPDVNGDGKADVCARNASGIICSISYGASFSGGIAGPAWSDAAGWAANAGSIRFTDVNGDGKADVCGVTYSSVQCQLGNGTGAFPTLVWGPYLPTSLTSTFQMPDVNGDGRADVCSLASDGIRCFLSNGTYFTSYIYGPNWGAGSDFRASTTYSDTIRYPDLNGDGKADVCGRSSQGVECWLSTGNGYTLAFPVLGLSNANGWNDAQYSSTIRYTDINGDGQQDLCARDSGGMFCYQSTGSGWGSSVRGPAWSNAGGWSGAQYYTTIQTPDVDGDGLPDLCARGGAGISCVPFKTGLDLLSTVRNGLGGYTTVGYRPSSAWANTYLPAGMIFQTASSLTTGDGRTSPSTVQYSFQGGLWSSAEHTFLGFGKVTSVIDAAGDYTETYYHQHVGCVSKVEHTYFKNASGQVYTRSDYVYADNASAPYTSLLQQRYDYECNLGTSCRSTSSQITYDGYGNATVTYEFGDTAVSGDERYTIRGYYPNTSAYIVSKQGYENKYDVNWNILQSRVFNYDGNSSYTQQPSKGDMTYQGEWNNTNGQYLATVWYYDGFGNVVQKVEPGGSSTYSTFDPTFHVFKTKECNALNQCSNQSWNPVLGEIASFQSQNGFTVSSSYDAFGRLVWQSRSDGSWEAYGYYNWGEVTMQRVRHALSDGSGDGLWTEEYFDGMQRPYKRVAKSGTIEDISYLDASKRPWMKSLPHLASEPVRWSTYAYDGAGRLVRETHPDSTSAWISYGVGYSTSHDELNNQKTTYSDVFGRLTRAERTFANGSVAQALVHVYDALGRVVKTYDPARPGSALTTTYDSIGRKIAECDYDLGCTYSTYDNGSLLVSQNTPRGSISMTYDVLGRPVTKTVNGLGTTLVYDEAGHGGSIGKLTSVYDSTGSESLSYSASGEVTWALKCINSPAGTDCRVASTTYDLAGRKASTTYPDGEVVTYGYDANSKLISVSGYLNNATYDSTGQLTSASYANGTVEHFAYDPNRLWLNSANVTLGGSTLYQASYGYDAAARVVSQSSTVDGQLNAGYGYDELSRLTSVSGAQSFSYGYDALGNMTWNSALGPYSYNDPAHLHAVTDVGPTHYTYDSVGNMVSASGATNFSAAYDAENHLLQMNKGGVTTNYTYDWSGRRVVQSTSSAVTSFFSDLFEVSNVAGSVTATKYVYAGGKLIAKNIGGAKQWYHQDRLGSVRLITDAAGSVVGRFQYTPFGTMSGTSTSGKGFGGHRGDDTGLLYMGARYYDPSIGRFLTADTLIPDATEPQALNRYSYVYNNPIGNTDPTGHVPVVAALVIAIGATGTALAVVAWVAFAATAIGYVTHNEFLLSVGAILDGYVTGGGFGAFVATAGSPISPLDPKLKQAISWAYTVYGLVQGMGVASDSASSSGGGLTDAQRDWLHSSVASSDPTVLPQVVITGQRLSMWDKMTAALNGAWQKPIHSICMAAVLNQRPQASSRLGAYQATMGYPKGTVGYATNTAICSIYVAFDTFGEEQIGNVFNSAEAKALYAAPVESAASLQMATIEYNYWNAVHTANPFSAGGWMGVTFSPEVRDVLQKKVFSGK